MIKNEYCACGVLELRSQHPPKAAHNQLQLEASGFSYTHPHNIHIIKIKYESFFFYKVSPGKEISMWGRGRDRKGEGKRERVEGHL